MDNKRLNRLEALEDVFDELYQRTAVHLDTETLTKVGDAMANIAWVIEGLDAAEADKPEGGS